MKKYRKKPVVFEAVQYDGQNQKEIREWAGRVVFVNYTDSSDTNLYIETLGGQMAVHIGDWIIKGPFAISGCKSYPDINSQVCFSCKPDTFEATYEEAL